MIPTIKTEDQIVTLTPCGSWRETQYYLDARSALALNTALASKRPLLVKGEPGLGKSYLALAAASVLERAFIAEVITSQTEGRDLLWQDNPVQRLNDAQIGTKKADELHPKHYLNPGVLWWAFDWQSAYTHYKNVLINKIYKPQLSSTKNLTRGIVLLIDEIDKADPALPNSLLEVLGNGGFEIPLLGKSIGQPKQQPLVIITTNDERELPPAFVRRCLVLHLKVEEDAIEQWLKKRVRTHISEQDCSKTVLKAATEQFIHDRQAAAGHGLIKPGLAEFLDLIRALVELTQDAANREQAQQDLLEKIAEFTLRKAEQ